MNVLLFQVDGKIPNLALMRVTTWHKQKGCVIEFLNSTNDLWVTQADRVYASSIFDFIMHVTQGVKTISIFASIVRRCCRWSRIEDVLPTCSMFHSKSSWFAC